MDPMVISVNFETESGFSEDHTETKVPQTQPVSKLT